MDPPQKKRRWPSCSASHSHKSVQQGSIASSAKTDVFLQSFQDHREEGDQKACKLMAARLEKITPEQARAIVGALGSGALMPLLSLRSLDVAAARELSQASAAISLPALTNLDKEVAHALTGGSTKPKMLMLDGLQSLDKETAEILAKGSAYLRLNGLQSLSEETAWALSCGEGDLFLDGLKRPDQACLDGLASGSKLCTNRFSYISLSGITTRTLAAQAPPQSKHTSPETGRQTKPDDPPESDNRLLSGLTKIGKNLLLGGVRFVSSETAAVLGRFGRDLYLPSVYYVDSAALAGLARVRGALDLSGLRRLPSGNPEGVHALAARTECYSLGFECAMGRKARMLLRAAGGWRPAHRRPAAKPLCRANQLLSHPKNTSSKRKVADEKLSWSQREAVAKSICCDVFEAIANADSMPCAAPLARWLTERVDVEFGPVAAGRDPVGVSCLDVCYFLAERAARRLADRNSIMRQYCQDEAYSHCVGKADEENSRPEEINDGGHLFRFLVTMVANAARDGRRKYWRMHGVEDSFEIEDQATGCAWAGVLADPTTVVAADAVSPAKSSDLEASVLAQAEIEHAAAERELRDLQAKGGGNLRRAKKIHLDALLWLEWTREKRKWSEEGRERKLGQQKFIEIFLQKYPGLPVDQTRLSRVIKQHRQQREVV